MQDLFIIAENHISKTDIVVSTNAVSAERFAAEELSDFLGQITGGEFQVNHKPGESPYHIIIGIDAAKEVNTGLSIDGLGSDGIFMQRDGNNLFLMGGQNRGTLYAVYSFLEDIAGCRWWANDASNIPEKATFSINTLNYKYIPQLNYRHTSWWGSTKPEWAVKNKLNGSPFLVQPKFGGNTTHGGVHTFFYLVPPYRHFELHPEWYSQIDGKRTPWHSQLCLTNKEMTTYLINALKGQIINNLDKKVFSVSQEDWEGNCQCEKCLEMDKKMGGPAGTLLHFINKVAGEIGKEYPDVFISTLAYVYSRKPPKNIKPAANVIIQLCNIECDFSTPMSNKNNKINKGFRDDIIGWSEIAERLYIWDYTTNFHHYYAFHPNIRVLGSNIRFFTEHNAHGIYEQGGSMSPYPEFCELRAWMISKLLWNPALDDNELIAEFCNGYYGKAGENIINYINIIHNGIEKNPELVMRNSTPSYKFITLKLMNKLWVELETAGKKVKGDLIITERILRIIMNIKYTFIFNWKRLKDDQEKTGEVWPVSENIRSLADEFIDWAEANNIIHIFEWHPGFRRIEAAVKEANEQQIMENGSNISDIPNELSKYR